MCGCYLSHRWPVDCRGHWPGRSRGASPGSACSQRDGVRGVWTPRVNYVELTSIVLRNLTLKASPLTGNELKFIRQHFGMTLAEFAQRFYVTHPAVLKWEGKGASATGMNWSTEKDIRLFIFTQVSEKGALIEAYQRLEKKPSKTLRETEVDLKKSKMR